MNIAWLSLNLLMMLFTFALLVFTLPNLWKEIRVAFNYRKKSHRQYYIENAAKSGMVVFWLLMLCFVSLVNVIKIAKL
jgi:hypothetical protein